MSRLREGKGTLFASFLGVPYEFIEIILFQLPSENGDRELLFVRP